MEFNGLVVLYSLECARQDRQHPIICIALTTYRVHHFMSGAAWLDKRCQRCPCFLLLLQAQNCHLWPTVSETAQRTHLHVFPSSSFKITITPPYMASKPFGPSNTPHYGTPRLVPCTQWIQTIVSILELTAVFPHTRCSPLSVSNKSTTGPEFLEGLDRTFHNLELRCFSPFYTWRLWPYVRAERQKDRLWCRNRYRMVADRYPAIYLQRPRNRFLPAPTLTEGRPSRLV